MSKFKAGQFGRTVVEIAELACLGLGPGPWALGLGPRRAAPQGRPTGPPHRAAPHGHPAWPSCMAAPQGRPAGQPRREAHLDEESHKSINPGLGLGPGPRPGPWALGLGPWALGPWERYPPRVRNLPPACKTRVRNLPTRNMAFHAGKTTPKFATPRARCV